MTDMGCACVCSVDYDRADVYSSKVVTARKQHKCCECGETIEPGGKYEYVSGCWDGSWDHYKTCEICLRIRNDVCCGGGFLFGQLREEVWEAFGVDYVTGETPDDDDEV